MHDEDRQALAALRARGYHVHDIQEISRDQRPFAVRIAEQDRILAPGVRLHKETVELGGDDFTNVHTLRVALSAACVEAESESAGFHLSDWCSTDAVAAVNGSFSFISDEPGHQPAEPCLDFCSRHGETVSLPTVTKPAFLVYRGQPSLRTLPAVGTLIVGGSIREWIGSKEAAAPDNVRRGALAVFGAANCTILYADNALTGFTRFVERAGNVTPRDAGAVDAVVERVAPDIHVIRSVHPGGGANLFTGCYVLRAAATQARPLAVGAEVRVTGIAGIDTEELDCGISVGPSAADAAAGEVAAYDVSLGISPFRPVRYARTLLWKQGETLCFRVFDGAPLTDSFRGMTPVEVAHHLSRTGVDPRAAYHLDGGQSSKIAFRYGEVSEVVGNLHYLQWPSSEETTFRWRGIEGRRLHSAFIVRAHTERFRSRQERRVAGG
ncbi:phosphodiester glycosidase family protein [Streptomyces microflavus]|uniref:hypothetical protein n=1 Tax=Streptomyces TaxID=1883 RepID=UPI001E49D3AE|nr:MULTISPECIES: hypothetical protein [Streptomyces]MDX2977625.1 hypothetical protein [Streptomyces sp. NRRL_B-2249]WSS38157.1 hypothetical protein OG269_33990 [Streptomyces microflavus]WST13125.1 hypothetical protein OG721_03655 [Streptomyces microflavus]